MLQDKIKLDIFMHAKWVYPEECCGVVMQKSRVQKFIPIKNVAQDPMSTFELDAQEYHDALDMDGWKLVTVVHSHCGDGASTIPSDSDIANCNEHQIPYTIVSIPEGDMRIIEPAEMPLIGRPWVLGLYDCYGLIIDFHKMHGVTLKDRRVSHRWWDDSNLNLYADYWREDGFEEVTGEPRYGDMIIFQISANVWNHAGMYVGDGLILHHTENQLSRTCLYNGWYRDHKVLICRHKELGIDIHQNY